jgi:hypothetical protein
LYSWLCVKVLGQLGKVQDFKGRYDENEDWDVERRRDEELLCDSGKIVLEPVEGTRVEFSSRSEFFTG